MSAGGPADSVYKSSEASPLRDLLARINQAPAVGRLATPLQDFLTKAKGNDHKVTVPPRDRRHALIQHCWEEMPPHKSLLTVNGKDDGNRL